MSETLDIAHKTVLELARAGSLDFAVSEYERLGLNAVRNHQDIQCLGGRLFKDLYLSHSGEDAIKFAQQSFEKYDEAFADIGGYYSGINTATMNALTGASDRSVKTRVDQVLDIIPQSEALSREDKYYAEASRAEAFLLLGDKDACIGAMQTALDHDPLNYVAHATTLKQFRMILAHRNQSDDWISQFEPPKSIHFGGHIFQDDALTAVEIQNLREQIADQIQINDIGFGYGALAAGSDILIAETLLEEGGELHVRLPVNTDLFIKHSVAPYGESRTRRFHQCLKNATSVSYAHEIGDWPNQVIDQCASLIAMGHTIIQAEYLSVTAGQLLISDQSPDGSYTSRYAQDWINTGRPQFIIPFSKKRVKSRPEGGSLQAQFILSRSDTDDGQAHSDLVAALQKALEARDSIPYIRQSLHIEIDSIDNSGKSFETVLSQDVLPGSIILSDAVASFIAVHHFNDFKADFIGNSEAGHRLYALREKGIH